MNAPSESSAAGAPRATPRRGPGLFWTFAGAFLAVLVLAAVLQAVIVALVVEPFAARAIHDRAELLARRAATAIAALPAPVPDDAIEATLRDLRPDAGPLLLAYRGDGRVLVDRPVPPQMRRIVARALGVRPRAIGGGSSPRFGRGGSGRRPAPDDPRSGPPSGLVPDRPPPDRGGPLPDGSPAPPAPGDSGEGPRVLAVQPVATGGEVLAVEIQARPRFLPRWTPSAAFLSLPLAVLIAGAAGLLMVRAFSRRLRALEAHADRVAAGNLEARIADAGGDELGRLGARLNQMTESLDASRRRILEQDRQRRRLFADITHELGTPLTSIRGYAETLLDPNVAVSEQERETYLRAMLDEGKRMDLLTQDLLELARLEGGASVLELERLDWAALCRNTVERFAPRFRTAGIALAWRGENTPAWVEGDGRRLERVLDNLLVNALRHVPAGGSVDVTLDRGGPGARHQLRIEDDGPGIPPDDLPHVFERFYRADPSRSSPGSGLGLAIAREIVLRHEGDVRATNRTPRGAAFAVELPAADAPA